MNFKRQKFKVLLDSTEILASDTSKDFMSKDSSCQGGKLKTKTVVLNPIKVQI